MNNRGPVVIGFSGCSASAWVYRLSGRLASWYNTLNIWKIIHPGNLPALAWLKLHCLSFLGILLVVGIMGGILGVYLSTPALSVTSGVWLPRCLYYQPDSQRHHSPPRQQHGHHRFTGCNPAVPLLVGIAGVLAPPLEK